MWFSFGWNESYKWNCSVCSNGSVNGKWVRTRELMESKWIKGGRVKGKESALCVCACVFVFVSLSFVSRLGQSRASTARCDVGACAQLLAP